jgi:putative ABC transport system permease protein
VSISYLAEFACIGAIAAFIASIAANLLAYYLSTHVLDIPFHWNFGLAAYIFIFSVLVIPIFAWLGLRSFLNVPPRQLLNSI